MWNEICIHHESWIGYLSTTFNNFGSSNDWKREHNLIMHVLMWYNIKNADALIWFGFSKTDILIFQNSLIGFFDFNSSPQPPGFIQFYYASIRLLEKSKLILMNCMTNYYDVYKLGLASFSKFLRMHSRVFTFLT